MRSPNARTPMMSPGSRSPTTIEAMFKGGFVEDHVDENTTWSRRIWTLLGIVLLTGFLALAGSVSSNKRAIGESDTGLLVVSMDKNGIGEEQAMSEKLYRKELEDSYREFGEDTVKQADDYIQQSTDAEIEEIADKKISKLSGEAPLPRPPLYTSDEEGRLREEALKEFASMGPDAEFSIFSGDRPPGLLFSKLHKVGGTSVALALDNVTKYYDLKGGPSRSFFTNYKDGKCKYRKFDVFYQHAWRAKWMQACLPGAAMVTVFREPSSRYISHGTWYDNRRYFIEYPDKKCDYENGDRKPLGGKPFQCHDDEFRHQFTLDLLLKRIKEKPNNPMQCGEVCSWVTLPRSQDPNVAIEALQKDYALYVTTERVDEFLVILALRFGWSLDTMIYEKCKDQGKVKVSGRDLKGEHAWAMDKIRMLTTNEQKVYDFTKQKIESYLKRLGPGFHGLVKIFRERLGAFHKKILAEKNGSPRWLPHGSVMMC
eukprot:CAMPEP_0171503954 /NCGR_PEP_ID=MMETSP0958-20121227/11245_1 /TAXON_ID=87120 /ORGANISM="Aurantiochytrium limacinum, Strain ATCCMYA-1381" /LENGTH=483 /DNA_ID=CAMNT_0012039627 /DNA_START=98 /DNA_END=1549 /DNA_ORIENTATION=-